MKVRFSESEGSKINNLYELEDKLSLANKQVDGLSKVIHAKEKREKLYKIALICFTVINVSLGICIIYKEEIIKFAGSF